MRYARAWLGWTARHSGSSWTRCATNGEGLEAKAIRADINVEADVERLVAETIGAYGRVDVAFNNAGMEGEFTPFLDQSNETYDTIFNANVRSVFWSMKHEAKAMLAQGAGSITTPRWAV